MMNDSRGDGQIPLREGLCPRCANVQVITSDRGTRYYLCRLSFTDDRFPKYPRQPVIACMGFTARAPGVNSIR